MMEEVGLWRVCCLFLPVSCTSAAVVPLPSVTTISSHDIQKTPRNQGDTHCARKHLLLVASISMPFLYYVVVVLCMWLTVVHLFVKYIFIKLRTTTAKSGIMLAVHFVRMQRRIIIKRRLGPNQGTDPQYPQCCVLLSVSPGIGAQWLLWLQKVISGGGAGQQKKIS